PAGRYRWEQIGSRIVTSSGGERGQRRPARTCRRRCLAHPEPHVVGASLSVHRCDRVSGVIPWIWSLTCTDGFSAPTRYLVFPTSAAAAAQASASSRNISGSGWPGRMAENRAAIRVLRSLVSMSSKEGSVLAWYQGSATLRAVTSWGGVRRPRTRERPTTGRA